MSVDIKRIGNYTQTEWTKKLHRFNYSIMCRANIFLRYVFNLIFDSRANSIGVQNSEVRFWVRSFTDTCLHNWSEVCWALKSEAWNWLATEPWTPQSSRSSLPWPPDIRFISCSFSESSRECSRFVVRQIKLKLVFVTKTHSLSIFLFSIQLLHNIYRESFTPAYTPCGPDGPHLRNGPDLGRLLFPAVLWARSLDTRCADGWRKTTAGHLHFTCQVRAIR